MEYTPALQEIMERLPEMVKRTGAPYTGSEHLLLALLGSPTCYAGQILQRRGLDQTRLEEKIRADQPDHNGKDQIQWDKESPKLVRILEIAEEECAGGVIGTEHVLFGILSNASCAAYRYIAAEDTEINQLFREVEDFLETCRQAAAIDAYREVGEIPAAAMSWIKDYTRDMTAATEFSPVIGREKEVAEIIRILLRRTKNNPCLVGEAGVGKTAIVEGLSQKIRQAQVPPPLLGKRILSLDLGAVLAGTKYRGEFEERFKGILNAAEHDPDIILFLDELHTVMGAGGADGAIDASNLMKPALARGKIRLIGATTFDEYRKYIEKDKAMERRFAKITVAEPSEADAYQMLLGLIAGMEQHHALTILPQAAQAAVRLSVRYQKDRYLPDKAIDILDEACAAKQYSDEKKPLSMQQAVQSGDLDLAKKLRGSANKTERKTLTADDVTAFLSEKTGIPIGRLDAGEREKLQALPGELKKIIFGQDLVIDQLCSVLSRNLLGLRQEHCPTASFLLLGTTGVGKTALAKALALVLFGSEEEMISLDMTEYSDKMSVSRLLGAAPGYVGYDESVSLCEAVRRKPYCVVLFDELEKADDSVNRLLLQVTGEGRLTDSTGHAADFSNTILILTANTDLQQKTAHRTVGFGMDVGAQTGVGEALFSKELLTRLDGVYTLHSPNREVLEKITRKELDSIKAQIKRFDMTMEAQKGAIDYLCAMTALEKDGVRGLIRQIRSAVASPISEGILCGEIAPGSHITIARSKDKKNLTLYASSKSPQN